jgi:hypothetical protein
MPANPFALPESLQRLQWTEQPPPLAPGPAAAAPLLEQRARFWAAVAPPIYGARVLVYPGQALDWD